MGLADIAAGVSTTTEQADRGVAEVDATDRDLAERLASFGDALPCEPAAAAAVAEAYVGGAAVDAAAHAGGVPPVTAAKTLHRLGFDGLSPVTATGERVLADYLQGRVSRDDARGLLSISEAEFALATYLATHDPIADASGVVDDALANRSNASVEKRDALAATMPEGTDFR